MIPLGALAAPLVRCYCTPRAAAFSRALGDVALAQRQALSRIVEAVAGTDYGRFVRLDESSDLDTFRSRVPVSDYAALEPWIERQRAKKGAVISPGRIRCYEPTSGSSGAAKLIPYNDALMRSFRNLFAIWAHDLLKAQLKLSSGRIFMSISPQFGAHHGLSDDREYLGAPLRALVGQFLVAPDGLRQTRDPDAFRDALSCALVNHEDLEIVSVWNASYLIVLLEHFELNRERLASRLCPSRRGTIGGTYIRWSEVWPRLQLVSCWTGAAAASPARRLAALLPHAAIQGKGLIATEAPVTVPLTAAGGCVPLVDEIFIELEDQTGALRLLHEAQDKAEYTVIITQASGLLRYRLGDRVRVCGRFRDAPLLEFVGRADAVADMVGEKLAESFVLDALSACTRPDAFSVLVPVLREGRRPFYCLLTDDFSPELVSSLDARLSNAFRYGEARMLGQLGAAQVIARTQMRRIVHDAFARSGMKAGDIKDRALIPALPLAEKVYVYVMSDERAAA